MSLLSFAVSILMLIIGFFVAVVFYNLTLQRAMNKVRAARRPFAGGWVWLGFVPYLGAGWLFIYQILLSRAIRQDFRDAGRADHQNGGLGFSVGMAAAAVAHAVLLAPGIEALYGRNFVLAALFYALAFVPLLVYLGLWIGFWVRIGGLSLKMPLSGPQIPAPYYIQDAPEPTLRAEETPRSPPQ